MWARLAILVVFSGCGFRSTAVENGPSSDAPVGDAPVGDAPVGDAAGDGPPATDCFQHWFDGTVVIASSTVKELTNLSSGGNDRDPWISADGMLLYFARNPGTHQNSADIYFSRRTSLAQDFTNPQSMDNLDTDDQEGRASVSGDDLTLVLSGNHGSTNGKFQIIATTRNATTAPFNSPTSQDQLLVASVNAADGNDHFDPFLTRDGLKLYFTDDPNGAAAPQPKIVVATRAAGQNFAVSPAAQTAVQLINSASGEADPALSRDERIIVFTSERPAGGQAGTNLWYATRQDVTGNFSAPRLIPTVNTDSLEGDPMLSDDGCELYFASNRNGGYHLFHAQVTK